MTDAALANQILRANHVAQRSLRNVESEGCPSGDHHGSKLGDTETTMRAERTRPSLLASISPVILQFAITTNEHLLGEESSRKLRAGIEKGFQKEIDDQIRTINEMTDE